MSWLSLRTKPAYVAERSSPTVAVSGVEAVNDAAPERRTEYPPRWSRMSRWIRGRACLRCEPCGVNNGPPPNLLTVHHLDGNKWNLPPWNLAALWQVCRHKVQWTLDFCQANLTGIYPEWLRAHVQAYALSALSACCKVVTWIQTRIGRLIINDACCQTRQSVAAGGIRPL